MHKISMAKPALNFSKNVPYICVINTTEENKNYKNDE